MVEAHLGFRMFSAFVDTGAMASLTFCAVAVRALRSHCRRAQVDTAVGAIASHRARFHQRRPAVA